MLKRNKQQTPWTTESAKHLEDANINADMPVDKDDPEQEFIEVTQDEVKKALKVLVARQDSIIQTIYSKHTEYNYEYFDGGLSLPFITVEKMSSRTLGSYTDGTDATGVENHIRFNSNFIALNTETRILETLRHEMIHQYQDQVLYEKLDKDKNLIHNGEKRPKDWHNVDFREWAEIVGIPAIGKHCSGNPAIMPESKSYNRKFACECIATNGYKMTVWSTREVNAICTICKKPFVELVKAGSTIAVTNSTIEKVGEDMVRDNMLKTFNSFNKFGNKDELTKAVALLKGAKLAYKEGIYQKGHRAYMEGYHYWLAYNAEKVATPVAPIVKPTDTTSFMKGILPKHEPTKTKLKRGAKNND